MVAAVRHGWSMRNIATQFHVAPSTVLFWIQRAGTQRLDRVDWSDRPHGPHIPANKYPREVEDLVLTSRRYLRVTSDLGEFGAAAIRQALHTHGVNPLPSLRTIGRILERRGALDSRWRIRRPPPPRGWYLPEVAARHAEVDSFDIIEGLVIKGGTEVEVLTGISLHSGLVVSWPRAAITASFAGEALVDHWRQVGLPAYAQFDNDTRFQGPHQHPDSLGRVTRMCLSLGVVPVFAPPRESGFQASIENFNGRWQAKVWVRFQHASLEALQLQSAKFIAASRRKVAPRLDGTLRRPFPLDWAFDSAAPLQGHVVFLRRTSDQGTVTLLGHTFAVDPAWVHRLVRAEVDLSAHAIRFCALKRREPTWQPLLREVPYTLPWRRFRE